ncbi:MAG: fumarylacetoacetate hydrolase family protein [Alphaproteobacteria bacterium]|nr:fumarylacetoacetate hydrolase family protein [Alphaproteobacteria bacterium]
MKLVRFGERGSERPGILDPKGRVRDLSAFANDITPELLSPEGLRNLRSIDPAALPLVPEGVRLGVPVAGIRDIFAIGLNYRDHAAEAGMALPTEPVLFSKATGALSGPNDPVVLPPGALKGDWEVELALVIGRCAFQVSEEDALSHVAGYLVCNDVSERTFQLEQGGQWIKGKSADSFCPLGPWLVTSDDIPDPQDLDLWLDLNGQRMQTGNTRNMVFSVAFLISYVSRFLTLKPGDVITTGTPAGVGLKSGRFLRPGDVMHLGVEGLGEQRQAVRAYSV